MKRSRPSLKEFCRDNPKRMGGKPCYVCQLPPALLEEVNAGLGVYSYPQIAAYLASVGFKISPSAVGNHTRARHHVTG